MSNYEIADNIHEPLSEYKRVYKDLHNENVKEYFNNLVKKSGINEEENRDTIKKIKKLDSEILLLEKLAARSKIYRVLIVLTIIIGFFVFLFSIFSISEIGAQLGNILAITISPAIISLFFFLLFKKLNPKIKNTGSLLLDAKKERNKHLEIAKEQLAPLNRLFVDGLSFDIFTKTVPLIKIDSTFNSRRLDYFVKRYGLNINEDKNRSTLYIKSGEINGNPFYISKDLVHSIGNKTYHGSITITYSTYITVQGKRVRVTKTQVLTASVTKPCPYFTNSEYLVYGNEAAPDLSFSRHETDVEDMTEKQIEKKVNKEIKKLQKLSERRIIKGGNYTVLGNPEFEVLFGATDRDNEVQFRLLFTPLAQRQLLALMKEKTYGFGDEFNFVKKKKINYVYPKHLEKFNLEISPSYFYGYDIDVIKKRFITYNNDFFQQVYFSFAPILAIPLYQQQKPQEFIYQDLYDSYNSFYEHEKIVNTMNAKEFIHPLSQTRNILKTKVIKSKENVDTVNVSSYGYQTINHIEYVSKLGLDGRTHRVPVEWTEYIPVTKTTTVAINYPEATKETPADRVKNLLLKLKNKNIAKEDLFHLTTAIAYIVNKNE